MLKNICHLAIKAGKKIMSFYNCKSTINIKNKIDNSPITEADINANKIITQGLLKITPNIPILSEENIVSWNIRKHWKQYWLIDPLDGTREFIKNNHEFTVNIALIKNKLPILGVVYVPVLNTLYYATTQTSWKENINKKTKKIIKVKKDLNDFNTFYVLISNSHKYDNAQLNLYLSTLTNKKYKIVKMGSSLKFCLIAEGKAHFYPRFGKTKIWDTAAGQIIATSAGANVYYCNSKKNILYNLKKKSLFNKNFCVSFL